MTSPKYPKSPFIATLWLLIACVLAVQFMQGGDGDKNWLLLVARKLLNGERLYLDVVETNPPFIAWLYTLPAWLGNLTGVTDYYFLVGLTFLLAALSLHLCSAVLRQHTQFRSGSFALTLHRLLLGALMLFFVNSIYFGDREHLFFICALPYLLRCMPTLTRVPLSKKLRIGVCLLASVGFCVKPHCLIFYAAVQLLFLWRARSLRPLLFMECWLIPVAWAMYLAAIFCFVPLYFTLILPMLMATYDAYKNSLIVIFLFMPAFLSACIAFSGFRPRIATPYRADIYYLLWLCAASVLYLCANNGWLYTFYPLNSLVLLAVGWVWFEYAWLKKEALAAGAEPQRFRHGMIACAVVMVCNVLGTLLPYFVMVLSPAPPGTAAKTLTRFEQIVTEHHFRSFGAMAISSSPWPRLARATHADFVTRFHHLWMMPKLVLAGYDFRKAHENIQAYVADALADDMNRRKPQAMFVDASPQFGLTGKQVDLIAFFSMYPAFSNAWSHYRLLEQVNYCDEVDPAWQAKPVASCDYNVYERVEEH